MKYAVLGAAGQLGQELSSVLPGTVMPLTRAQVDLTSADNARRVLLNLRPDVVINCAAYNLVDRAETEPRVFTRIHIHFVVRGRGVDPARVRRAIELSVEKYCSASAMLAKTAEMTHDFEVVDTTEAG